jgi:hypothetical protein
MSSRFLDGHDALLDRPDLLLGIAADRRGHELRRNLFLSDQDRGGGAIGGRPREGDDQRQQRQHSKGIQNWPLRRRMIPTRIVELYVFLFHCCYHRSVLPALLLNASFSRRAGSVNILRLRCTVPTSI